MNRNILVKLVIDFVMIALMLVEMAYNFTGNMIHELIGISLFILFTIHNILNRQWYKTIFKGKINMRRILSIAVNLLLLVTMIALLLSAIPISRIVFAFLYIHSNGLMARQVHILASYWGLIFVSVHLGMHWKMIMCGVRKIAGVTGVSRIRTIVLRVAAVLIVIYGVWVSFHRNIGSKLILYYTFESWNPDESIFKIFSDYLSIIGMYICVTYYFLKMAVKNKKN